MSNTRDKVNTIHIPDLPFEVDLACLKDKNKIHGRLIKSRREVNSLQSFFAEKRPGLCRKEKIKHVVYQDRHRESSLYEYHSNWDIYKDKQGKLYAIYDKKPFFEKTTDSETVELRWMQDIETDEWKTIYRHVIKINNADKIVMKNSLVAVGSNEVNLYNFLSKNPKPKLSPERLLDIAIMMVEAVESKNVKCAIDLKNILYDFENNALRIIDLGFEDREMKTDERAQLGMVLMQVLGLGSGLNIRDNNGVYFETTSFFRDQQYEDMAKLIAGLNAPVSEGRPSLAEVKAELTRIISDSPRAIGILNIEDYRNAKNKIKFIERFKKALRSVDTVFFVDHAAHDAMEYAEIKKLLGEGISIHPDVLVSNDSSLLVPEIKTKLNLDHHNNIFYFHPAAKKMDYVFHGAQLVEVDPLKTGYRDEVIVKDAITIKTLSLPPQVDFDDLEDKEQGWLLSEENCQLMEKVMEHLGEGRYSKDEMTEAIKTYLPEDEQKQLLSNGRARWGMIKENDPPDIYAVYRGMKQGKEIGKGGNGIVKCAWKLRGPWCALKMGINFRLLKRELASLKRANLSKSKILTRIPKWRGYRFMSKRPDKKDYNPYELCIFQEGRTLQYVIKDQHNNEHSATITLPLPDATVTSGRKKQNLTFDHYNFLKAKCSEGKENLLTYDMFDDSTKIAMDALSRAVYASGGQTEKHNFLMEYAAGNSINTMYCDYYDDDRQFSLPLILDVALQSALAIKELHDKGLLHRDIKGGNLIYDFFLNKATIVDFGEVVEMKNGFFTDKKQVGTDRYWAPEILNKDNNPLIHYSPKSDVYAFGVMLDLMFKPYYDRHDRLKSLIESMKYPDYRLRPTLEEIILHLKYIRNECMTIYPRTVALIDINDYDAKHVDKEAMTKALKSVDSVVLVDNKNNGDVVSYTEKRKKFIKYFKEVGMFVREEVLISENPASLVATAKALDQRNADESPMTHVCFFNTKKNDIVDYPGAQYIAVTTADKDYREEIENSPVPVSHYEIEKTAKALDRMADLLQEKITTEPESVQYSKRLARKNILVHKAAELREYNSHHNEKMTYRDLVNDLNALEWSLIKNSSWKTKVTFGFFNENVQSIGKIENKLKNKIGETRKLNH